MIRILIGSSLFLLLSLSHTSYCQTSGENLTIQKRNPSIRLENNSNDQYTGGVLQFVNNGTATNGYYSFKYERTAQGYNTGGGYFFLRRSSPLGYVNLLLTKDNNDIIFNNSKSGSEEYGNTYFRNGKVGIGMYYGAKEALDINGNIRGNRPGGALRVQTDYGYIDVGAQNGSYAHIYTGLEKFIFNKTIYSVGAFSSYQNNLSLQTSGTTRLTIDRSSGHVGIGTTSPTAQLDVRGDMYLEGSNTYESGWSYTNLFYKGHSLIIGSKPGRYAHNKLELKPGGSSSGFTYSALEMYSSPDENVHEKKVRISSYGDSYLNGGKIGIGTDNPTAKLHVNGNILASEVKVSTDANNWPDFVFEEGYDLTNLENVESFIKTNKHLPNVPSAKEVEAEGGIELGEMNRILLQKIEELTLHAIRQENEIKSQKELLSKALEVIQKQEEKINSLSTYLEEN